MSEQNNIAVRFKNVCKTYRLYTSSRRRLLGLFFKSVPHKTKHAVVDMNLTVERGEAAVALGEPPCLYHVVHRVASPFPRVLRPWGEPYDAGA